MIFKATALSLLSLVPCPNKKPAIKHFEHKSQIGTCSESKTIQELAVYYAENEFRDSGCEIVRVSSGQDVCEEIVNAVCTGNKLRVIVDDDIYWTDKTVTHNMTLYVRDKNSKPSDEEICHSTHIVIGYQ